MITVLERAPLRASEGEHRSRATERAQPWVVLLPAVVALAARGLTGPRTVDDAYITFRYARNLAQGLGLVYNPGELVLGTTAPLWALILAGGYRVGLTDLPALASGLAAVCDALSAALIALLALRIGWGARGAVLVGIAWALNPMSIAFSVGGMETSLFVLICLGTLSLAAAGHLKTAALLAGGGMLVRPESALLAVTVVAWTWQVRRSELARVALLCAMVPLGMAAALTVAYGSPLPNTIAAKQVAYQVSSPFENLFAMLLSVGLPGGSNHLLSVLPTSLGFVLALVGLATLAYLTRRGLARRDVGWQPFAIFAALYVAFYTLLGLRGVRMFAWYLVPLAPLVVLAAAAGLARVGAPKRWWLAAALVAWQLVAIDWRQPLLPLGHELVRERALYEVGLDLRNRLPSDAVVAAPEIGALGYASNLRILDTVGLVSPVSVRYYPLPANVAEHDNAIPARLIEDLEPTAVVSLDAYTRNTLVRDAAFERDYRLDRTVPAAVWRSREVLVFLRDPR